jgi:hypothetical protein
MAASSRASRIVPLGFGLGMLALVLGAALAPNTGAVPAQSSCQYGDCIAGTGIPYWAVAVIAVLVVAALAAALILLRRRRGPPAAVAPWQGEAPSGPTPGAQGTPTPAPAPKGPTPDYLETPEDVAQPPPAVPPGAAAAAGAGAAAGAAAGAGAKAAASDEPDIDSLMAELDKISGEILKRQKKPAEPKADDESN